MMGGSSHLLRLALGRGLIQPVGLTSSPPNPFHYSPMPDRIWCRPPGIAPMPDRIWCHPLEAHGIRQHFTYYARKNLLLAQIVGARGLGESINDYDLVVHFSDTYGHYGTHTHDFLYHDYSHTPLAHRELLLNDGRDVHFFIRKKCSETTTTHDYKKEGSRCLALSGDKAPASAARPGELAVTMQHLGFPDLDSRLWEPAGFGESRPNYLFFGRDDLFDVHLPVGTVIVCLDDKGRVKHRIEQPIRRETERQIVNAENDAIRAATTKLVGQVGSGDVPQTAPQAAPQRTPQPIPQAVPQAAPQSQAGFHIGDATEILDDTPVDSRAKSPNSSANVVDLITPDPSRPSSRSGH